MENQKVENIQNINLKIKELLKSILEISEDKDLEQIKSILPVYKRIDNDFKTIEKIYLKKSSELDYDKVILKLLTWFTMGEKMFSKSLYLNQKVNIENSDLEKYQFVFANYPEELKHSVTNVFKIFEELIKERKNYRHYRYIYTFYQTLIINVLYLLPENYRSEVLNTPDFIDTKKIIETSNYNIDLKDIDFKTFYKYIYEDVIIDFIANNYDIDLHNMSPIDRHRTKKLDNA